MGNPVIHMKVRDDLEYQSIELEGNSLVLVRDPLEIQSDPMVLSPGAFTILQLFDGERAFEDVHDEITKKIGPGQISMSQLRQLVETFERAHLLETETFHSAVKRMIKTFQDSTTRKANHAGVSYPAHKEELALWVSGLLEGAESQVESGGRIAAVISPHLDLRVEKDAYAATYAPLRGADVDRVIVFGTGHKIREGLFSLTHKSFETPLGVVPTERQAVELLREVGGALLEPHDFSHRHEHSIEFQLPFLQVALANPETPIIPILCGSMLEHLEHVERPSEIEGMSAFLDALKSLVGPKTLIVCGVDFCHVGLKFGHPYTGEMMANAARAHDRLLLNALCEGEVRAFWKESRRVMDFYNVCGFSSMSLLLELLPGVKGDVRRHDFWHEADTRSAVSFASVLLSY